MSAQTNLRDAHPRVIFSNEFSPALGTGLLITNGCETLCRSHSHSEANRIRLGRASTAMPAINRQSPFSIACGILLPRRQWADGRRVSRSRSLSIFMARIKAAKKASSK